MGLVGRARSSLWETVGLQSFKDKGSSRRVAGGWWEEGKDRGRIFQMEGKAQQRLRERSFMRSLEFQAAWSRCRRQSGKRWHSSKWRKQAIEGLQVPLLCVELISEALGSRWSGPQSSFLSMPLRWQCSCLNLAGSLHPPWCWEVFLGWRRWHHLFKDSNLAVLNPLESQACGLTASLLISQLGFESLLHLVSLLQALRSSYCSRKATGLSSLSLSPHPPPPGPRAASGS